MAELKKGNRVAEILDLIESELNSLKKNYTDLHIVAKTGSYIDLENIPLEFNPASHQHDIEDIVNLYIPSNINELVGYDLLALKSEIPTDYISNSLKGVVNGIATLDNQGKVLSSQLPSYVDVIIEGYYVNSTSFKNLEDEEAIPEAGRIYVDVETNKTYRWSGSQYTSIANDLAIGETSSTAFRGDYGKIAYDHSQITHAPSNAQKNVQSNWNEESSTNDAFILNKPNLSNVALSGSYSDLLNKPSIPTVTNDLTDTLKNRYDVAYTHSQSEHAPLTEATTSAKGLMSSSDKTNLNANTSARHTHSNKSVLDTITASKLNMRHYLSGDSGRTSGVYTYYALASFPTDNSSNSCSLTIDGRIGGWNNGNKGYLSMMISNRDGISASGTLLGNAALSLCDLVVYTSGSSSSGSTATLYLKTYSWFAFDLTLGTMSGTSDIYTGVGTTTTPSGTLQWSLLSNQNKFLQVKDSGEIYENGNPVVTTNDLSSATVLKANYLNGFSKALTSQTWGNQVGTFIFGMDDSTGGSIAFRRDNPNSGQLSMIIDGTIYINEGYKEVGTIIEHGYFENVGYVIYGLNNGVRIGICWGCIRSSTGSGGRVNTLPITFKGSDYYRIVATSTSTGNAYAEPRVFRNSGSQITAYGKSIYNSDKYYDDMFDYIAIGYC